MKSLNFRGTRSLKGGQIPGGGGEIPATPGKERNHLTFNDFFRTATYGPEIDQS